MRPSKVPKECWVSILEAAMERVTRPLAKMVAFVEKSIADLLVIVPPRPLKAKLATKRSV